MQKRQTGDCRDDNHRAVKSDFYPGKFNVCDIRNRLHTAFSGKRNQVSRQIQKDTKCDKHRAGEYHGNADNQIVWSREIRYHVITKSGKVSEYNANENLQELHRFELFAQQQDLDHYQYNVEKNRGFSHLDAPDTGHCVGNRTDRGYAEVGLYGQGDADCHNKKPDKIHGDSYF